MTNTHRDTNNNKRTMSRQHHRSLSTPSAGFYDIMGFFTGVSQNRGMAKVRRAHTTAITAPTLTAPGRKASLQSPLLYPHLANVYKGQALPQPLCAVVLLQNDLVDAAEEEVGCGFLLTREQSEWGVNAVSSEICRRHPPTRSKSSLDVHRPSSTSAQVSTIFRTLFKSQSVTHRPRRHDSLSSKSLPWHPLSPLEQPPSSFYHTVAVSKISQPIANVAAVDASTSQPRHHSSSPCLRQDSFYRYWGSSSATKDRRTRKTLAPLLTSEAVAIILDPLSMQALLELLALIVSKGPESFTPSYSDDFSLFVQPHGKSYQDLVNLLPKLSQELMTKVVVTARHWARYEDVEVLGRRRHRYSIEDCSRDDLSLSGFGNITSQELPSSPNPNRACLQNLASALFSNNLSSSIAQLSGHMIISHGAAQNKHMKDHRIQRSTEETLQSISSTEVEIDDRDAMVALENLMLLHESVDQLESWKRFSDAHVALPLPPWRTTAAKVVKSTLEGKKATLLRKSSRGHSVSKPGCTKVRGQAQPQPHDVSALIPLVPSRNSSLCTLNKGLYTLAEGGLSADEPYNYKTSYWQFKHRQGRARHDLPPCRVNHMVTATVRHPATALLLDNESETMSVSEETCLSGSLNSESLIESSDSSAHSSQRNSPATTPQHELAEFVAPPMKDLYSAPIVIDFSQLPPGARPPALGDSITSVVAVSSPKKNVTAAIDTFAIKAATKKRPPPFTFPSPPSPTVLSKSMTTTSPSPTTVKSFTTKVSTKVSTEQEGKECLVTVKKGWRICEKPLMHWKRKSASAVLAAASSHPRTSAPSISSSADRVDFAAATPRTSSPIAINAAVASMYTAAEAASTFPASTNPSKRLGLGFSIQTQNDTSRSKASRPNLNILIKETTSAASLPSSDSFTSQDSSLMSTSSPGLGCSIASIPFPEDYMSMVLSPSSSTSALWAAPTPMPTLTVPNGSSPRMDNIRMVTSISPLPSPSTTSAGSRKKRLQEKLFGKKSKLPLDDTCSSLYPCPLSPSIQHKRVNVHNGEVAGVLGVGEGVGAGGGGVDGENGPVLKSPSSFGSLKEKKSFGQLIVPLVLAPLEQRGILKTRSRSSSSASVTAVGAACPIHCQDSSTPPSSYPRHCYDPLNEHGHHHYHRRPPFHRANSRPIAIPVLLSSSSSPSPTPGHTAAEHRYHNKLPIGSVASGVGGVSNSRDDKEANAQIWKVIHEWGAWMDAHSASFK